MNEQLYFLFPTRVDFSCVKRAFSGSSFLYFEKTLAKCSELQHQQPRGPCVILHTHAPPHIHDHPSHSNTQHFTG